MRADQDGMMLVRAELCDRLDALQQAAGRIAVRDFAQRIGALKTMAAAYGLIPVVCIAEALERALAAEPRLCPAGLYFDRLRDAIGCDAAGAGEAAASEALLASISIRLRA
jgi:hypothetical protein